MIVYFMFETLPEREKQTDRQTDRQRQKSVNLSEA